MCPPVFREFELEAIRTLTSKVLSADLVDLLSTNTELVGVNHTGFGYFQTVRHTELPDERIVCAEQMVLGTADSIRCGFIVFLEDHKLTLECHGYGESLSDDIRDLPIVVETA